MCCELHSTTNGANFQKFLQHLKSRLRNAYSRKRVYLVLDNHTAHATKLSAKLMADLNFYPLFLPAYTSYFNSVENLWALLKQHFMRFMCIQKTHLSHDQFSDLIRQSIALVPPDMAANLYFANRKYLCEQLQKADAVLAAQ